MRKLSIYSIILLILSLASAICVMFFTKSTKDSTSPEIKMNDSEIYASVNDNEEALIKGVYAVDNKDGNVTNTIVIESISNFIEKGRRRITMVAFDNDNNIAKATRDIIYTDYTSPKFALESPFVYYTSRYTDLFTNITAQDCLDGDISEKIMVEVDESDVGGSAVSKYSAVISNSAGDVSSLPVTLVIYDPSMKSLLPSIELTEYLIYADKGKSISPLDYIKQIMVDGASYQRGTDGGFHNVSDPEKVLDASRISVENPVNKNEEGVYEIVYSVVGNNGVAGEMRLIVVIE